MVGLVVVGEVIGSICSFLDFSIFGRGFRRVGGQTPR
jgi:hypothetical protein